MTLRCQLWHCEAGALGDSDKVDDPKFRFESQLLRVPANQSGAVELKGIRLRAQHDTSREEGTTFVPTVDADEKPLFKILRQFESTDATLRRFNANHGFTGLVYATHPQHEGDDQLSCGTTAG